MGAGRDKDGSNAIWLLNVQRGARYLFLGGGLQTRNAPHKCNEIHCIKYDKWMCSDTFAKLQAHNGPIWVTEGTNSGAKWWHFFFSYFMYFVFLISAIFIPSAK